MIVGVESPRDSGQAVDEAIYLGFNLIAALQKPLNFMTFAHNKAFVMSLNQRRVAEQQAVVGAGEAQIAGASLAEAPDVNHWLPCLII